MISHSNIQDVEETVIWQSDWAGDEVGYDDTLIVGLYHLIESDIYVYIDAETGYILESWSMDEE